MRGLSRLLVPASLILLASMIAGVPRTHANTIFAIVSPHVPGVPDPPDDPGDPDNPGDPHDPPSTAPEPSTLVSALVALSTFAVMGRRRRR